MASIGDKGALKRELPPSLSEVWIDRDLSWLDFNDRVLAEALDDRTALLEPTSRPADGKRVEVVTHPGG